MSEAGWRRFENTKGKHNKFWEVRQEGLTHYVRFGRMGSGGWRQGKPVKHANTAAAVKAVAKLIREKLGKGYVEVTDAEGPTQTPTVEDGAKPTVADGFLRPGRRLPKLAVEHRDDV